MTVFETYFPLDTGPGANSDQPRWRKMASLWQTSGVEKGHVWGEFGFVSDDGVNLIIGGGAVWCHAFYGEQYNWVTIPYSGPGLFVATFDVTWDTMYFGFSPGMLDPIQDPAGSWQVPLWQKMADGTLVDRRVFIPPVASASLPDSTPRGITLIMDGPGTQVDVGVGEAQVHGIWLDWSGLWAPGRSFRISAYARVTDGSNPVGNSGASRVWLRVSDSTGIRRDADIINATLRSANACNPPYSWAGEQYTTSGQAVTYVPNMGTAPLAEVRCITAQLGGTAPVTRFMPNSCRIEVEDVGIL
jgi:hypothetical protein